MPRQKASTREIDSRVFSGDLGLGWRIIALDGDHPRPQSSASETGVDQIIDGDRGGVLQQGAITRACDDRETALQRTERAHGIEGACRESESLLQARELTRQTRAQARIEQRVASATILQRGLWRDA
jgi:hypothetical protein